MTTIQLYRKHKAGEVSREKFLYEVRRDNNLPFITNLTSYIIPSNSRSLFTTGTGGSTENINFKNVAGASNQDAEEFPRETATNCGDINGDGIDDILIKLAFNTTIAGNSAKKLNHFLAYVVYGKTNTGVAFNSVELMLTADDKAQALFDACFKILSPPDAPRLTIQELENELILMIDNPISSNNYQEAYEEIDEINITDPTVDRFYRFEGYQIFQLKDADVSIADIADPDKSRLVAQCDKKNNIARIINFVYDEALGFSVPVEKVKGGNVGIQHTFQVKEDAFAQGERRLVNHKTYYYVAVAYAYNQFKEYNPNDPLLLDGQKIPYISSRISYDGTAIKPVSAVPHNPMPEAGGTAQMIAENLSEAYNQYC